VKETKNTEWEKNKKNFYLPAMKYNTTLTAPVIAMM
jgi:hypothetical protein